MSGLAQRPEEQRERYITVNGAHIKIRDGQDPDEAIREQLPSKGGEKAKNTKEAREQFGKGFKQRYSLYKGFFKTRDLVTWDKYTKTGLVAGFDGDNLRILDNSTKQIVLVNKDYVYKVNELTSYGHWDAMDESVRVSLLKEVGLNNDFVSKDFMQLPDAAKDILKATSPAGYDMGSGGFNTGTQGKVNPVGNEQTVSERIREEISRRAQEEDFTPPKILNPEQESQFEQEPDADDHPLGDGKVIEGGEPTDVDRIAEQSGEPPKEQQETANPVASENPQNKEKPTEQKEEPPKEKKEE